jgi:hypothetical protein
MSCILLFAGAKQKKKRYYIKLIVSWFGHNISFLV